MLDNLLAIKSLVIASWLLVFLCWERVSPATAWKPKDLSSGFSLKRHYFQNLSLWLVVLLVSPLLMVALTAPAAYAAPPWRPEYLSGAVGLMFDILVLDLWIYWWHRANHRIPFLWRFHQIHHFDQQLDASSAFRFHFGEVILSALVRAPFIFVLAIPLSSIVIFESLVTLAAIFHHSNARLSPRVEGRLSRLVITPAIHWVHHHAVRADTDSNYGTLFSWWDRLFRSRSSTRRSTDMALGIEGEQENRINQLFLMPFWLRTR